MRADDLIRQPAGAGGRTFSLARKYQRAPGGIARAAIPPDPVGVPCGRESGCIRGGSGCSGLLELPLNAEASPRKIAARVLRVVSVQPRAVLVQLFFFGI